MWYAVKTLVTLALILMASEVARFSKPIAAFIASLPLVSILAMVWMYCDGEDTNSLVAFSYSVFFLVLPSLLLFIVFPLLLQRGWAFPWALGLACTLTACAYLLMARMLSL